MKRPPPFKYHLLVNGKPYCDYCGTTAGLEIAHATKVSQCSYLSIDEACMNARVLYCKGLDVAVGFGGCPTMALEESRRWEEYADD